MALRPLVSTRNLLSYTPTFMCSLKPSFQPKEMSQKVFQSNISRRIGAIAVVTSILSVREVILTPEMAFGLDMRMVDPEQALEEAMAGIKGHAQSLLDVKSLLESESWREAQKELRMSSSNLKLDMYARIQSKPGNERPQLRKLYFDLFNNVTKLDYAARDKDVSSVWQCYGNIVVALNEIMDRI